MNRGRMAVVGKGGQTLDSGTALTPFNASIKIITGTEHTLSDDDSGYYLVFTSDSAVTLNIPHGIAWEADNALIVGIVQLGAGAVTPTAAGGVSLISRQSLTATAGVGAEASLLNVTENAYVFGGDRA